MGEIRDFPNISPIENNIFKSCQFGKETKVLFNAKEGTLSKPLGLIHTDLCGSMRKKFAWGEQYFILFIDYFTRMCWIRLLKHKGEAFNKFKVFKDLVQNRLYLKIICLRYDGGEEFISDEFFNFCEQHGIKRNFSIAKTPQQN